MNFYKFLLIILGIVFIPFGAMAEQKLILTVTPPLFQLNIGPGEFWASSLKVVNTNPYDLTLYASTMNFEASGEVGQGKFIPLVRDDPEAASITLAHWIEIESGPFLVPREKSIEIPFSVRIPQNAPPGGHYAAILVGTRPPREVEKGASIQVSSFVSSLIFVRIKGEVVESGDIREFFSEHTFYQKPDVTFTLRFENKGNVHLQPQGDITIYNMWGKERGKIPINQKTDFGNVLPKSVRKFVFEWQGEESFFEAGRYKAVATLTYGKEARQNISQTTYFWVVPLTPVAGILGGLALFILIMTLAIRAYIKRALLIYQEKLGIPAPGARLPIKAWIAPVRESTIDMRDIIIHKRSPQRIETRSFLKAYRKLFSFLAFFALAVTGAIFYLADVHRPEKSFDVILRQGSGEKINISSEELIKEKIAEETKIPKETPSNLEYTSTTIKVLNGSGVPGLAARISVMLEEKGFTVYTPANAKRLDYKNTSIQFKKEKKESAALIREFLSDIGTLEEAELEDTDILIIVGKDFAPR